MTKPLPTGITRLPSGRYRARVKVAGHDESATFSTVARAARWREEARDALLAGRIPPRPKPTGPDRPIERTATVLDAARAFGQGIGAGTVRTRTGALYKPSTSRRIESLMRVHVLPRIGAVPAASLTRRDVQAMVNALAAEHGPETARKAVNALSAVLRVAEDDGTITTNPCRGIRIPKADAVERPARFLTPAEADAVVDAARADDAARGRSFAGPLVALALSTGLRLGELLALHWGPHGDDGAGLDLDGAVVRVRWSLDRVRDPDTGRFAFVRPKSRAGVRDVPLSTDDVATMRRHLLATGRPAVGALVWADPAGDPLDATGGLADAWERIRAAAGLSEPLPRFHDLRHTWCVTALRAGVRPEAVAKLGGWADVAIIHRRYGKHALPDELAGAAEQLAAWRAAQRAGTT